MLKGLLHYDPMLRNGQEFCWKIEHTEFAILNRLNKPDECVWLCYCLFKNKMSKNYHKRKNIL